MRTIFKILILALSVTISNSIYAQFSAGVIASMPAGTFSDFAGTGFGGSLQYEEGLSGNVYLAFSLGYVSFTGKDVAVGTNTASIGNTSMVPASVGIQYDFTGTGEGFYAVGDLTVNFVSFHDLNANSGGGGGYTLSDASATRVGFSPGLGYRAGNWDFKGRYNLVTDFNYADLRIGYVFNRK